MTEKLLIINEKESQYEAFCKALTGSESKNTGHYDDYDFVITHAKGHLLGMPVPEKSAHQDAQELVGKFSNTKNIPWKHEWFDFDKRVPKNAWSMNRINDIKDYLNQGYIPVIASDNDESGEGDALIWEILDYLYYKGRVYREYHKTQEVRDVQNAMKHENLKVVTHDDPKYRISHARNSMDFLTQQYTRVATKKLLEAGYRLPPKEVLVNGKKKMVGQVVPMGRLQSVILLIIGNQEKEIKNYKPSKVYESRYKLGDLVLKRDDQPKFKTKEEWNPGELPELSSVKQVSSKKGITKPPKGYVLSQVVGKMAKYGMSSKETTDLIQTMYDADVLSYPRSDENFIGQEDFEKATKNLDVVLDILDLPAQSFTHRTPRKGFVKASANHGALRYGSSIPESLEQLVQRFGKHADDLYRVITERFVQMYLEDTEWIRYNYETVDTPKPFSGSVRIITKQSGIDNDKNDDVAISLPDLNEKAKLYAHTIKSVKPHKITTDWLFEQLRKYDIGTEATRVQTQSSLSSSSDRRPIKEEKVLSLTQLGWVGYEFAKNTKIANIEGTMYLQGLLKDVSKTGDYETAYDAFDKTINDDIESLRESDIDLTGLNLPKNDYVTGEWNGENVRFNRNYGSHRFSDDEVNALLNGEEVKITLKSKAGKDIPFTGKLAHLKTKDGHPYVGFDGKRADQISGIWNGQEVTIKNSFMDHTFTDDEINRLFNSDEIQIETHKDGKTYHMKGTLEKQSYKGFTFYGFKPKRELAADQIKISFKGKEIVIKNHFMDHKFTQDEIEQLSAGENITIETHKDDKTFTYTGKIEKGTYKGHTFYAFHGLLPVPEGKHRGTWHKKTVTYKKSYMGHEFTPSELSNLDAGLQIEFEGESKSGKKMKVKGKLANLSYEGHSYVGFKPDWGNKKRKSSK